MKCLDSYEEKNAYVWNFWLIKTLILTSLVKTFCSRNIFCSEFSETYANYFSDFLKYFENIFWKKNVSLESSETSDHITGKNINRISFQFLDGICSKSKMIFCYTHFKRFQTLIIKCRKWRKGVNCGGWSAWLQVEQSRRMIIFFKGVINVCINWP